MGVPVFVTNIDLVCVRIIIGIKQSAGFLTMALKSLTPAYYPGSSIVKIRY